jgi:hypothetical protein
MESSVKTLNFNVTRQGVTLTAAIPIDTLVIAGWTGRDATKLELHIRELEAIGVARPVSTPMFYRVSNHLLTLEDQVQVLGADTTSEVEVVLLQWGGEPFIGVGSDLTDRRLERAGVALAKQACAKPVGPELWSWRDIAAHWDALMLRSVVVNGAVRSVYQEGSVTELLPPTELAERFSAARGLAEGALMFCGTLPVHGALRSGTRFEMELVDPVLHRALRHAYEITELDVVG